MRTLPALGAWRGGDSLYLDPKSVCKILALMAIIMDLGLLFFILLGFI